MRYSDFAENKGRWLLDRYKHSHSLALMTLYPDHSYLPWLFSTTPKRFFLVRENRKKYVEWLRNRVEVGNNVELSARHFLENHGGGLLTMFGGSPEKVVESLEIESEFNEKKNENGVGEGRQESRGRKTRRRAFGVLVFHSLL